MVNEEYQGTENVSSEETTPAEEAEAAPSDIKCGNCGETHPESEMVQCEGDWLCKACADDETVICEDCNKRVYQDHSSDINDGHYICNDCRDNSYSYCDDCERYVLNDYIHCVCGDDRYVCDSCYDSYRECAECGYVGHEDNMRYCGDCENDYCENCGCSCGDEEEENSRKPRSNFSRQECTNTPLIGIVPHKIKYPRLVGIEIEAERDTEASNEYLNELLPRVVGVCSDGSIDSRLGCEIQTPPASYEKLAKMIKDVTKTLRDNDFSVNRSCGLHIHLDASDFKRRYSVMANIIKTYYAIEDVFYDLLPDSRKNNEFCMPLRKFFSFEDFNPKSLGRLEEIWYEKSKTRGCSYNESDLANKKRFRYMIKNSFKKDKYNYSRYTGVNVHSIFYRGTLEIRHHSGTLNATKIYHWVNFNLAIVEYAMKRYNEAQMKALLEKKSSQRKLLEIADALRLDHKLALYLKKRFKQFQTTSRSGYNREEELINVPN